MTRPTPVRMLIALLLVVSAIAFLIGVNVERSNEDGEAEHDAAVPAITAVATSASQAESEESGEGEAGESHSESDEAREAVEGAATSTEASESAESGEAAGEHHEEKETTLLGIKTESNGAIAAAVVLSLVLAVAILLIELPVVFALVIGFALIFAALDIREAFHQADESRGGLAGLALLIAVLHIGAAVACGRAYRNRSTS